MLKLVILVVFCLTALQSAIAGYQARAWQNNGEFSSSFNYPEKEYGVKQNVALAFTGGGSRSYIASLGYIAGLEELGLMDKVDYIGGISGGNWATMVYIYGKRNSESEFLGPVIQPEDMTEDKLKAMNNNCARAVTDANYVTTCMKSLSSSSNLGEMWCYGTQKVYLDPVGIPAGTHWAWNQNQIDDILQRNPSLSQSSFILPQAPNSPYPLVGATLVGPQEGAPYTYKRENQNYTFFEMTPIYSGHVKTLSMEYNTNKKHSNDIQTRTVGGFIETFAFNRVTNTTDGTNIAPAVGLDSQQETGILNIPEPTGVFDIAHAAGASSFAPGAFFDSFKIQKPTSLHFNYYSPVNPLENETVNNKNNRYDTLFADGGSYENIPLISFLQRGVKKVIYCSNSASALQPSSSWNTDTPGWSEQVDTIDDSIPAFFGINLPNDHKFQDRSYEYNKDQIFAMSDYKDVVDGLQTAQSNGKGIIYRTKLKTVENKWWGIEGGIDVDITFVLLGRLSGWEALLNDDMKKVAIPKDDATDLSKNVKRGSLKHFPNFGTNGADLDNEKANALASLTAWSFIQHKEMFEDIFA